MKLIPGMRFSECYHVNARVGFQMWASVVSEVKDGIISTTRISDTPRIYRYETLSGIAMLGPSHGFSMPYIPKLDKESVVGPMIVEDPDVISQILNRLIQELEGVIMYATVEAN